MNCVACEGTGVSTRGRPCSPCSGTGKKKEEAPLFFDVETHLIKPARTIPPLVCLSLEHDGAVDLYGKEDALEVFEGMLDSGRTIVGHNVVYDLAVMCRERPDFLPRVFEAYEQGRISCTMIRQKLIDLAEGHYYGFYRVDGQTVKISYGLDALCLRLLGLELPKSEIRLQYAELDGVPIDDWSEPARDYAMTDVAVTSEIWHVQQENNTWHKYLLDQYRQCCAAWWIQLMQAWGLRTDPVWVKQFASELQADFDQKAELLMRHALVREDGSRDTKAAMNRMVSVCMRKGLDVATTDTGRVSLSADACGEVRDELMQAYAEFSSIKKQISTDIPLLERGTVVPIHPRWESLKETGRTGTKPNVQNVPVYGKMRECFIPRPGMVFASADYDGFELRAMSQFCFSKFKKSRLAEALNRGLDPHLVVASKLLKISYGEAKHRKDADDDEVYRARQSGKICNFGFPGGLGALSFVSFAKANYNVEVTEDEARKLKDEWLESWPEFRTYFAYFGQLCEQVDPQFVQLFSNRFRGNIIFTEACNGAFQGLAADAAKAAGFLISRACYTEPESPLYGSRIVNFIHDEFILESPERGAAEAAEELARLMVKGASLFLPDVPPKASPLLMRRWSKKAKELRDENGRLIPWNI